jgi:hypothetical protein
MNMETPSGRLDRRRSIGVDRHVHNAPTPLSVHFLSVTSVTQGPAGYHRKNAGMEPNGSHRDESRLSHGLSRLGRWIGPDDNPAGVIYGTMTAGVLLAAESTRHETRLQSIAAAALALALYWAAHSYSSLLGDRLETGRAWSASQVLRVVLREAALLKGAALPLVVLLLADASGASTAHAVLAALVAAAALLVVLEVIAGRRARLKGFGLVVQVIVAGGLGLGIFELRVIVH